jgi:hypothetical protein
MWLDLGWYFIPDSDMLAMLRSILAIDHVACQESALHGLGHWCKRGNDTSKVEAIIDDFLRRNPKARPELREYALRARTGMVM